MRYAAFLRAINVGKHNRITMADLRDVCEGAGLGGVSTYLQTGNVLFDSKLDEEAVARLIEAALVAHGLRNAPAVVRNLDSLEETMAGEPFAQFPTEEFTRYVTLFREPLSEESGAKAQQLAHVAAVRERELLSVAPVTRERGIDLNAFLPKNERMQGTTRYLHVVEEIIRLLKEA